jgi:hypothetical protein
VPLKRVANFLAFSVIFKRLLKVNNSPMGGKSPNLVTLSVSPDWANFRLLGKSLL